MTAVQIAFAAGVANLVIGLLTRDWLSVAVGVAVGIALWLEYRGPSARAAGRAQAHGCDVIDSPADSEALHSRYFTQPADLGDAAGDTTGRRP